MDTNGHTILCEDYVNFEIAKLLKEKGFCCNCDLYYWNNGEKTIKNIINLTPIENRHDYYSCPTQSIVLTWLRYVHFLFVNIYIPFDIQHEEYVYHSTFGYDIFNMKNKRWVFGGIANEYDTYEQACEAAIKYTLENLI